MNFFFVPTWSGDFRLLRTDSETCQLHVENPTANELTVLGRLLTAARANKWTADDAAIADKGVSVVELAVPIERAGPIVSGTVHGDATTWTAVRSESGKIIVVSEPKLGEVARAEAEIDEALDTADVVDSVADDSDERWLAACTRCGAVVGKPCVTLGANPRPRGPHKARKVATGHLKPLVKKGLGAVAAAAVRRPKQGCPAPTAAARRASEVLSVFSTTEQYAQFQAEGCMLLTGSRTGRSYWLFHRDEAARRRLTHSLLDSSGAAICVWDERVPAEEEALAIKLAVEHREGWLLRAPRGPASLQDVFDVFHETWADGQQVRPTMGFSPYDPAA